MNSGSVILRDTAIFGFDSAWTNKPKQPGAICALLFDEAGMARLVKPELALFEDALAFIHRHAHQCKRTLIALDQPTLVPNPTGMRPVEKVAASIVNFVGGGVQPASQKKANMFGPAAPVWAFKKELGAIEDPERARNSETGRFLIEVFPALSLPSLNAKFSGRKMAPKYNPANRQKFRSQDWGEVVDTVLQGYLSANLPQIADEISNFFGDTSPAKEHQDCLDSLICVLIGLIWLSQDRSYSVMIGDLVSGYMISPLSDTLRPRLEKSGIKNNVPVR